MYKINSTKLQLNIPIMNHQTPKEKKDELQVAYELMKQNDNAPKQ